MAKICEPLDRLCALCSFPLPADRKTYHVDCYRELANLRKRMRRRQDLNHDEITWRFENIQAEIEWLLNQSSGMVKGRIGDVGQSALLAFRIQLRRPD